MDFGMTVMLALAGTAVIAFARWLRSLPREDGRSPDDRWLDDQAW